MKTLWPLLFILALACCPSPSSALPFSDKYDRDIRRAVALYWPTFPHWRAWKAQLYQESRLDPDARSPVGAQGLAQFMPGTWAQIRSEMKYGIGVTPFMAGEAIDAGAYYMAKLRRGWSSPRPEGERQKLAQASYNAGFGSVLKAQSACGDPALYEDIIRCLPQITGKHSTETITYVQRIAKWWAMMEAGL